MRWIENQGAAVNNRQNQLSTNLEKFFVLTTIMQQLTFNNRGDIETDPIFISRPKWIPVRTRW